MLRSGALVVVTMVASVSWGTVAGGQGADTARVSILVSSDETPLREAVAGAEQAFAADRRKVSIDIARLDTPAAALLLKQPAPRVVLALGARAVHVAAETWPNVPVVAGLVFQSPSFDGYRNVSGVYLDLPADVELTWLAKLLPKRPRVGVIYSTDANHARVEQARQAASRMGLHILARRVSDPRDLPGALDTLARQVDVLWGLADSVVLTPETARPILLFSLKNRIPFVGLSQAWVQAGAVAALDRDYHDMGRQCAEQVARLLDGTQPSAHVAPRRVLYGVNLRAAAQLGVHFPSETVDSASTVVPESVK